jgi:uncharacterized protein YndB with AHSA1/START domain
VVLASVADVWDFLAEPRHLAEWWPGVAAVEADRRGVAPGARWRLRGDAVPGAGYGPFAAMTRAPTMSGTILVLDVVPRERLAFQFVHDQVDAELLLEAAGEARTRVALVVEAPFLRVRRTLPTRALTRLASRVQTAPES